MVGDFSLALKQTSHYWQREDRLTTLLVCSALNLKQCIIFFFIVINVV